MAAITINNINNFSETAQVNEAIKGNYGKKDVGKYRLTMLKDLLFITVPVTTGLVTIEIPSAHDAFTVRTNSQNVNVASGATSFSINLSNEGVYTIAQMNMKT